MKTITLQSGNTLEIQQAKFKNSWSLAQAISAELAKGLPGFKVETLDVQELLQSEVDVGKIASLVCQLIASPTVYALLWPCFTPCLYNKAKINEETFEDEDARQDFLPCVVELLKANVVPFIKGLDLKSLTGQPKTTSAQK